VNKSLAQYKQKTTDTKIIPLLVVSDTIKGTINLKVEVRVGQFHLCDISKLKYISIIYPFFYNILLNVSSVAVLCDASLHIYRETSSFRQFSVINVSHYGVIT